MKKGLIFDLDGVLTDTARYHYLAWKQLADELGFRFHESDNERLKGVDRLDSLNLILDMNGVRNRYSEKEKEELADRKNRYYRDLIEHISPESVLPGIWEFLEDARKRNMKMAVASISKNAPRVLEGLRMEECFDYIADAREVSRPKPDPEIFLICADRLKLKPDECIGFEDSQSGIIALRQAGIYAVGIHVQVTSMSPDLALNSTKELNLEKILESACQRK